jgi:hypothetical protein
MSAEDEEAYFGPPMSNEEAAAYDAYHAEMEAEHERLMAIPPVKGHRAKVESGECESCGKTAVLYDLVACTLGYPGHPGAEFTAFGICEACLTK